MYTAGADLDAGSVADTKSVEAGARGAGACRRLSGAEGRNATALPPVRSWWSNVEDEVEVEVDRKRVALFKRLENTAFPAVSRRCTSSLVSSSRLICPRRRDIPLLRARRAQCRAECWRDRGFTLTSVVAAPDGVLSTRSSVAVLPAGVETAHLGCHAALAKVANLRVRHGATRRHANKCCGNVGGGLCVGVPAEQRPACSRSQWPRLLRPLCRARICMCACTWDRQGVTTGT